VSTKENSEIQVADVLRIAVTLARKAIKMKTSKVQKAATRKRILDIASQEFRKNGIHATSVAEIMAVAGLTHGGFYRHFTSKEQLVAEACKVSMESLVDKAEVAIEGGEESFIKHFSDFLSLEYHDDIAASCAFVMMGSELARADSETRRAASIGLKKWVDIIAQREPGNESKANKADILFKLSTMVGAVTMARIVDDQALSSQILNEARDRLRNILADDSAKNPLLDNT
jgi:TetR/AcrR family transcriptional repressor of nem operon